MLCVVLSGPVVLLKLIIIGLGQEDIEGLEKAIRIYAAQLPIQQMQVM